MEIKPDSIAPKLHSGDQPGDFAHSGFRIPLVVISPWAKPHYVSHTWRDLTSILRLIEVRFNVPSLTARDAAADNMMEFFDFSSPAWQTPPSLPTQPTGGTCNWNLEKAPGY
jgi:phospholipase C